MIGVRGRLVLFPVAAERAIKNEHALVHHGVLAIITEQLPVTYFPVQVRAFNQFEVDLV